MKNTLTFIALLFTPFLMAQQELDKKNFKTIGGPGDDIIHQSIQALNGNVYAVGETSSNTKGGADGYLIILNPFSQEKPIEKRFGGSADDVFQSIAALPNGNFVLAGKTSSKGNGKSDGWVMYINDKGNPISEKVYGGADNDGFNVVATSDNGDVFLAGYVEQKGIDLWLIKEVEGKLVSDKKFSIGSIKNIKSGVADTEGGLVLVGDTKKSETTNKDDIWVMKIDKTANKIVFNKPQGDEKTYEEASQIIKTSDGGYAVVGTTNKASGKKMNMWLLKLDVAGNRQWDENYGDSDFEWGISVTQTITDHFILMGSAIVKDARAKQIYTVATDERGRESQHYYDGGKQDDEGRSIINLYDGSFGIFCYEISLLKGNGGKDVSFFVSKINEPYVDPITPAESTFRFQNWKDALETQQETALSFDLVNTSSALIKNIQVRFIPPVSEIVVPPISYLGFMKRNETRHIVIPISTKAGLIEGEYRMKIQLMVDNKVFSESSRDIKIKKGKGKFVEINRVPLAASDTELKFVIENPNASPTKELKILFTVPNELTPLNKTDFEHIPSIPAGKSKEMTLRLKNNTQGKILKEQITAELYENGTLLRDKVVFDIRHAGQGSNNLPTTRITWHNPDEYTSNIQNIETDKSKYIIQLNVDALEQLAHSDFKVYIDNVLSEGKMDLADLPKAPGQVKTYLYRYSREIEFTEAKKYQIRVELAKGNTSATSRTIIVKYDPERPNLHILSIGTTNSDLKYPSKDAKDFATTLKTQAKGLFKEIHTTTLADSSLTTFMGIRRAFRKLKDNYKNENAENRIFSKDYLVVFVSSHGKTSEDKSFKLLPSDYNTIDGDDIAIDYQEIVMKNLADINCHKLVFIDACHSGAAGSKAEVNSEALAKLVSAATGMTTITSCRSNEQSYEDPEWQNGAFTEALVEALTNVKCTEGGQSFSSDTNNDHIITIGEIYNFIKRRVPSLIKTQKTPRTTEQNPVLSDSKLDLDVPIVSY